MSFAKFFCYRSLHNKTVTERPFAGIGERCRYMLQVRSLNCLLRNWLKRVRRCSHSAIGITNWATQHTWRGCFSGSFFQMAIFCIPAFSSPAFYNSSNLSLIVPRFPVPRFLFRCFQLPPTI